MIKYIFILALLTSLIHTRRIKRVVGGEPVKDGQYPFFAQLILPDKYFSAYSCSGSLIHPKWILTAADCFPITPEGILGIERLGLSGVYTVYMGSLKINSSSIYPNSITKVFIHPDFSKEKVQDDWSITHNLALAQLKWKYTLTDLVNTVYLAPSRYSIIKRCKIGKVISIGPTSWYDQKSENSINVVLLRVREYFTEVKYPSPSMFYSQALLETRHAFEDDVGAPFVCYPDPDYEFEVIQYGVVAGVMNTTIGTMITFIENVEKNMRFIEEHVPEVNYYTKMPKQEDILDYDRERRPRIESIISGKEAMSNLLYSVNILYFFAFALVVYLDC